MKRNKTIRGLLAIALLASAVITVGFAANPLALALDTEPYTPGKDYHIDEPESFRDQDIDNQSADDNESSTQYYLTSPFYLNWISPDVTINEGEKAYIGCSATGLNDLTYEWYVSSDGGKTYVETKLVGNEHTISGLKANKPADQPYLYRCVITNGDRTSTLEANVSVTVLPTEKTPVETVAESIQSSFPKTGDPLMPIICIASGVLLLSLIGLLATKRRRKPEQSPEDE